MFLKRYNFEFAIANKRLRNFSDLLKTEDQNASKSLRLRMSLINEI